MKPKLILETLRSISMLVLLGLPTNLTAMELPNEFLWGRQVGTPEHDLSHAVAVDDLGNLFLAWTFDGLPVGTNNLAYSTALNKYDLDGNLQWTRTYDSELSDLGYALAVDGIGNAFLGGVTTIAPNGQVVQAHQDAFLKKIDASGNTLWEQHFGSIEGDEIDGISVDGLGHIYVSGQTRGFLEKENAGLSDAFVSKFDEAGNQLWTRQFGSEAADVAWDVSADALGNVFISGTTLGVVGEGSFGSADTLTIKLDADGQTAWVRQWGSPYYDQSFAVQADGVGGAYIAGNAPSGIHGTDIWTGSDAFVGRYDDDGNLLWLNYLVTEMDDSASGLALDDSGNIYASGTTRGTFAGTNAGGVDSFIARFNADGLQQWMTQYGTEATDSASGLAVDVDGGIYSSGLTRGPLAGPHLGGGGDAYLLKFNGKRIPEPGSIVLLWVAIGCLLALPLNR